MISVVEIQSVSSDYTAIFTAVSALCGTVSTIAIFVYAQWSAARDRHKAQVIEETRQKLIEYERETKVSLAVIQKTTNQTHQWVNGLRSEMLTKLANVCRNHALLTRKIANESKSRDDEDIARAAELAAISTETELQIHTSEKLIHDSKTEVK